MARPDEAPGSFLQERPVLSRRQRWFIWLVAPVILAAVAAAMAAAGLFDPVERLTVDRRFVRRGPLQPDPRIVIVEITESARRSLSDGDVMFELREHLDDAIARVADAGAVVIGLDMWFQGRHRDPQLDVLLAGELSRANVVLGVAYTGGKTMRAPRVFLDARPEEGLVSVDPDPDGVLRRLPEYLYLAVSDRSTGELREIPVYPFPAVLAWYLLDEEARQAGRDTPVVGPAADGRVRLGDRVIRPGQLVNYAAGPGQGFKVLDFAQVVRGECDLSAVDGAAVIIGTTRSLEDQFRLPMMDRLSPGVYYQANVLDMILRNRPLKEWPARRDSLAWLTGMLGCLAGWYALNLRPWWKRRAGWLWLALYFAAGGGILIGGWWLLCQALFARGTVLAMVAPVRGMGGVMLAGLSVQLAIAVASMRRESQRSRQIESLFGRSVSRQVLDAIKADPARIARTEVREVTILFSDIRGFTSISSTMSPQEVASMLNEYFEAITSAVFEQDGFVDKFVGDELMAVFGAPLEQPDHAFRAATAALGIKRRLRSANEVRGRRNQPLLDCGIGLHSGPAAAGHIGSARRANYTVVGHSVNVAARIEELTTNGEILMSRTVMDRLGGALPARPFGEVELRGSGLTHQLYELLFDGRPGAIATGELRTEPDVACPNAGEVTSET